MNWRLFLITTFLIPASHAAFFPEKGKSLLKDLVEINSSTDNIVGLERMRKRLIPEFEELGFVGKTIEVGNGHKILTFKHPMGKAKVALIGHIDTVFSQESAFQKFSDEEFFLKGPGVNDMKGGIVLMLLALREMKDTEVLKSIQVTLNDDEEIGSPHSSRALQELTKGIPYGLVYEPTFASGEHVTTTQAGVEWLELKVKGRAAHAGAEHDKGINACVELGQKMVLLSKLTSYPKRLTVNPGVIKGGTKPNVVCEEASVTIDVRYVESKDLVETRKKIDEIVKKSTVYNPFFKKGTESSITELVHIPSLSNKSTQKLFEKGRMVAKKLGFNLKKEHMGGASDANQLASTGMELLAGLGPKGKNAHSIDEVMDVESFELRKKFSVELIKELVQNP